MFGSRVSARLMVELGLMLVMLYLVLVVGVHVILSAQSAWHGRIRSIRGGMVPIVVVI